MVVADIDDPFIPIPDDLLVNLVDSFAVVEALLDSLPSIFEGSTQVYSSHHLWGTCCSCIVETLKSVIHDLTAF